jgi:phosphopantothenoylcysteine decarboxylase / phosphopantothenate---cysteine ligase
MGETPSARRRSVVLGVTGSIAAYKAGEIIRQFRKVGVAVHVVMTPSARHFITPMTLGTLSGNPVTTDLFTTETGGAYMEWGKEGEAAGAGTPDAQAEDRGHRAPGAGTRDAGIRHIQASREADLIVVAPATGNILAKVAHGIADEPLSTAILASSVQVLFAPAMNTRMWENPATRENVRTLVARGFRFVDPEEGDLACGEFGRGKMADPMAIVDSALRLLGPARPAAPAILVTAGPTEEDIDQVRVISNRSSGKMGFAIAEAARDLGYPVTLVHGPASAAPPLGVDRIPVRTAAEMLEACERLSPKHPILIMAAAVADYRPASANEGKIASGRDDLSIALRPNPDILASLAPGRANMTTVGFALEVSGDRDRAKEKLRRKGCDMMVLNDPTRPGSRFGGDTNEVVFIYADGRMEPLPLMKKSDVAREILHRAIRLRELDRK